MRRALDYAKGLGVTLAQHCEDSCLADGGAMHEGEWSSRLGIPGMPSAAEEAMVARDIALVRLTGAPVHFLHLSTAGSVDLVRRAKAEGLAVTAEAAPHHMLLTHALVAGYDPVFKVNPPLRTDEDVAAVVAGLCDGTIDAVATDHAPHAPEAKDVPFDQAPPGMLGLQTALPIAWEVLSLATRARAGLRADERAAGRHRKADGDRPAVGGHSAQGGPIEVGAAANLCVFDPAATTVVEPGWLASRSRNTPYAGRTFHGAVRHTVLRGRADRDRRGGAAMTAVTGPELRTPALLVTADGAVFAGEAAGADVPVATGELVFNTAMSGYQEVITDPRTRGR